MFARLWYIRTQKHSQKHWDSFKRFVFKRGNKSHKMRSGYSRAEWFVSKGPKWAQNSAAGKLVAYGVCICFVFTMVVKLDAQAQKLVDNPFTKSQSELGYRELQVQNNTLHIIHKVRTVQN